MSKSTTPRTQQRSAAQAGAARSDADVAFVERLAQLLREHDLAELEVTREYGEDDELKVRLTRYAAVAAPALPAVGIPTSDTPSSTAFDSAADVRELVITDGTLVIDGLGSISGALAISSETTTVGNVTVFKTPDPDRRLDFVTIVPAKIGEVWDALTTEKGLRTFWVPGAKVELQPGGAYEMYMKPDAPPGQRGMEGTELLSFVPEAMLSGTGSAPPEFPTVQEQKTKWVVLLDAVDKGTRVQLSMIEWGKGPE